MAEKKKNDIFVNHYHKYKDKIYAYFVYRVAFDKKQAEDLTSEVFIKAFKSFDSFDESKSFQSWIFTIARNHLINFYKSSKKDVSLEEAENIASSKGPDIDNALEVERIIEVINKMDDNYRDMLIMRFVGGLTNIEIARVMEKEEGAVRTQISRALSKLRAILRK